MKRAGDVGEDSLSGQLRTVERLYLIAHFVTVRRVFPACTVGCTRSQRRKQRREAHKTAGEARWTGHLLGLSLR
jgi:hypothetical protein